ncbi:MULTISPECIES: hypothetical protein [unclassified Streptomyces]|uniref:hypothetical protein n=1 Tax=unclassified Streptomyces TaxID=2593676 RepID=UPI00115FE229|nr:MULTISPECIES: hypothetical protein [unclassified Streptomyces]
MKPLEALKGLVKNNTHILVIIVAAIGQFVALAAAITGETASLLALFYANPTSNNALYSVLGVCLFPLVGLMHIVIVGISESRAADAERAAAADAARN